MRSIFWFFFLLSLGCSHGSSNSFRIISVDDVMAGKIDDKAAVAIKGYLVLEKDLYFLYSNFESANYKSDERNFFRVKIWIPENMDMERCSNKSVIIYGVKYTYIGAPGIDEVVRVSDLGQSESSCLPLKEPFNRFQQLKARIEAGRQNKP